MTENQPNIAHRGHRKGLAGKIVIALLIIAAIATIGAKQALDNNNAGHAHGPDCTTDHDDHDNHAKDSKMAPANADHDDHDDHAKADSAHAEDHADHADHAEDAEDAHAGHDHGPGSGDASGGLTLSAAERRHAGIELAVAAGGDIAQEKLLRGQIVLNRERQAQITTPVAGVIAQMLVSEGDHVAAGQLLALLRSSELADMRLDYLSKLQQATLADRHAQRADLVQRNTQRLVTYLAEKPALAALADFSADDLGERLAQLVDAYSELEQLRLNAEREERLRQKAIGSEEDLLNAQTAYAKASAHYRALRDSAVYEERLAWESARADAQEKRFAANCAALRLRVAGENDEALSALAAMVDNAEALPPEADLARCEVRAAFAGTILSRSSTTGERVGADSALFTLADTSSVWVELLVYAQDLDGIAVGQNITICSVHRDDETRAPIRMISAVLDPATRAATVRAELTDTAGHWRPGAAVEARLRTNNTTYPVVVPRNAIQSIDGESVVFVPAGDAFTAQPVQLGPGDSERVAIASGLNAGTTYVAAGAYTLKAKLVTSALDPHAGHGH